MTPEQIESWRTAIQHWSDGPDGDVFCDLALDGLRFRKWVEAWETTQSNILILAGCHTLESYREAIDKFVVERGA